MSFVLLMARVRLVVLAVSWVLLVIGVIWFGQYVLASFWILITLGSQQIRVGPELLRQHQLIYAGALFAGLCIRLLALKTRSAVDWVRPILPLPIIVIGFTLQFLAGMAKPINTVRLPDGRQYMLAYDLTLTPSAANYAIWSGVSGLIWWSARQDPELTFSSNGSWMANPELIVTPDAKYLLVKRGGIWTDCLETGPPIQICDGIASVPEESSDDPDMWLPRSANIEKRTGISAGPSENRKPFDEE